jgi:stage IV sporulation protein FB
MSRVDRPLDNPINWSFRVGRLMGVEVRFHVAFFVALVVLIWIEMPLPGSVDPRGQAEIFRDALGTFVVLLGLVVMHDLGHWYTLRSSGGSEGGMLLWPLGGNYPPPEKQTPSAWFAAAAGGPLVNTAVCGVASGVLVFWFGTLGAVPWNPLYPMTPVDFSLAPTSGQEWLLRIFGVSYTLLAVNLLPMFPFDGGRMVQAWLWPSRGMRLSSMATAGLGMVTALVLGMFGLFHEHGLLLLMIAVFGYLTCWQIRRAAVEGRLERGVALVGEDDRPFRPTERDGERVRIRRGVLAELRAKMRARRLAESRRTEENRRVEVDDILRKVARLGLGSLTRRERKALEAETRRRRGE